MNAVARCFSHTLTVHLPDRYVGKAMSEIDDGSTHQSKARIPVIGIATWGVIDAREQFSSGGVQDYTHQLENKKGVPLDPNHTLFFLYDNGTDMKFGQEIDLKRRFEAEVLSSKFRSSGVEGSLFREDTKVFSVCLVVEGGPVTLKVVAEALRDRTPVVVIEGSGRAADVIAYAWHYLHDSTTSGAQYNRSGLRHQVRKLLPDAHAPGVEEKIEEDMKTVLELTLIKKRITVYRMGIETKSGTTASVDSALLEAILRSLQTKSVVSEHETSPDRLKLLKKMDGRRAGIYEMHQSKLFLSLLFNRVDVAQKHMRALRLIAREYKITQTLGEDLQNACMWSLVNNRDDFVRLIAPHIDLKSFLYTVKKSRGSREMCRMQFLYDGVTDVKLARYLKAVLDSIVPPKLSRRIEKKSVKKHIAKGGDAVPVSWQNLSTKTTASAADSDDSNPLYFRISHLIGKTLNKVYNESWAEEENGAYRRITNALPKKFERDSAYHDLLIWAVLTLRFDLAVYFWEEGGSSIPTALYASTLLASLSKSKALNRHGYFREIIEALGAASDRFELLAIGVLDECYIEHGLKAQRLLHQKLYQLRLIRTVDGDYTNALDLAVRGGKLRFVSHPACLEMMEETWNGDIASNLTGFRLFMNAICPLWMLFSSKMIAAGVRKRYPSGRVPVLDRFGRFYDAPIVKFYLDVCSFASLCVLFSSVNIADFSKPFADSGTELFLLVWMSVLSFEEATQCYASGFENWISAHANSTDFLVYFFYFIGVAVRAAAASDNGSDQMVKQAKIVFSMANLILFFRCLRLYQISPAIGPKLIMLSRMRSDVATFLALFLVLMLCYGVASTALIDPYQEIDLQTIASIMYRPFFQMFGNLFLEDIHADSQCIGPAIFQSCGYSNHEILPLLAGIYLLMTNVVLVNLLIAMMAHTYEEVQADAALLWRMQEFDLLEEYCQKSRLPNPFGFLDFCYCQIIKLRKWCRSNSNSSIKLLEKATTAEADFKYRELEYRQLESFQEKNTEKFRDKAEKKRKISNEEKLIRIEDSLGSMTGTLLEMRAQSQRVDFRAYDSKVKLIELSSEASEIAAAMDPSNFLVPGRKILTESKSSSGRLLQNLTDYDDTTIPVLPHILTTQTQLNAVTRSESLYPESPDRTFDNWIPQEWDVIEREGGKQTVCFAMKEVTNKLAHPDEAIITAFVSEIGTTGVTVVPKLESGEIAKRSVVPDDRVPWSRSFPGYDPPEYTAPYVLAHGPESTTGRFRWAHPEDSAAVIANGRLSASFFPALVSDGRPRNPIGRTGMTGRGLLGLWGPNVAVDQVVTRWMRNKQNMLIERMGRPVLEVVLLKRANMVWCVPGAFAMADGVNPALRKAFGLDKDSVKAHEDLREVEKILQRSTVIFQGYMDDSRNTDNAWVESTVYHCHDNTGVLQRFVMAESKQAGIHDVAWATVHRDLVLHAEHSDLLRMICQRMGAYW